ncbi:MAG: hypothetical protein LBQ60_11620 [Bacteroidales bacterium]|nr:hypothetical protein [Bacteroidales bacterium]
MKSNHIGEADKPIDDIKAKKTSSIIIAYNKPPGIVNTDQEAVPDMMDDTGIDGPLFPIDQSGNDSQGLVLLTNDSGIADKIAAAGNNYEKEYHITVNKPISKTFIQEIQSGIILKNMIKTGACSISVILSQGQDQKLRHTCEYLEYNVVKLECIRIMHIELTGLEQGKYRHLNHEETALFLKAFDPQESIEEVPGKKRTRIPKKMLPNKPDHQKSELENKSSIERHPEKKLFRPESNRSENTEEHPITVNRTIKSRKSASEAPEKKTVLKKKPLTSKNGKSRTYSEYKRGAYRNSDDTKSFGKERKYSTRTKDDSISSGRAEKPKRSSTSRKDEEIRVFKKTNSGPRVGKSRTYNEYKKDTSSKSENKASFHKGKRLSGKPEKTTLIKGKNAPKRTSTSRKNITKQVLKKTK